MTNNHIDASCGCKMFFSDAGDAYETRVEFCPEHEKMAAVLRKILEGFELVLADSAKKEVTNVSR